MSATVRLKPLLICIAVPLLGGWLSSSLSGDMSAFYQGLLQPSFAPPAWLFGVMWPLLYLLLGIASYRIWISEPGSARTQALVFYAVQLLLNFCWSPVFFRFGQLKLAFWLLCAILVLAMVCTACFMLIDRKTLWMTVPYILWLLYAAALNGAIVALNGPVVY